MASELQRKINSGFGPKSEPGEILAGIDLTGKITLVTGGYSGIGLETTRALAGAGARVHVPVRSAEKAARALGEVPGDIVIGDMDLSDLVSVKAYAERINASDLKLDILINNAGIMACPEARIGNNWESQFGVNHIGHFVLTRELLPMLLAATAPRVVSLSSIAHRRGGIRWDDPHFTREPYDKWRAYAQAKTANALFAVELTNRYGSQDLRAFSVHPGGILTPLQRHLEKEEMIALGWLDQDGNLSAQAQQLFKSPAQGCGTTLWAATSPALAELGGVYCEDCDVAGLVTQETPRYQGVADWAVDPDGARRLWTLTEQMVAEVS